jgi:hypothetical protein
MLRDLSALLGDNNFNLLFSCNKKAITCRSIGPQKENAAMTPPALNSGKFALLGESLESKLSCTCVRTWISNLVDKLRR